MRSEAVSERCSVGAAATNGSGTNAKQLNIMRLSGRARWGLDPQPDQPDARQYFQTGKVILIDIRHRRATIRGSSPNVHPKTHHATLPVASMPLVAFKPKLSQDALPRTPSDSPPSVPLVYEASVTPCEKAAGALTRT
jgi:hypothetical protein